MCKLGGEYMYIARQPIFDRNENVYGYELLFRGESDSTTYDGYSSQLSTATVLSGLFEAGIDDLIEDKKAFINFDSECLCSESLELIDSSRMVIEVLEDIKVDQNLLDRIIELKKRGYSIALDDFVENYTTYPLVPLANIIKYDLMASPLNTLKNDVKKALEQNKILLAEKVESAEEFADAKKMGFHLFQGYFFSKPNIVGRTNDKTTSKMQYIRLINELNKSEPSYQVLAEFIGKDVRLAYRLIRVVTKRSQGELIYSIKRALTYIGLKELKRWINILMIRDLGNDKPEELMRLTLVRSKFAERIAIKSQFKEKRHEASMMGLFSMLDGILDQTMEEALDGVALPEEVKNVLIYRNGTMLPIYNLIEAYEVGEEKKIKESIKELEIPEEELFYEYKEAIKWSKQVMDMMQ